MSPESLKKTLVTFSKQCPAAAAESSEAKFIHPQKSGDSDVVVVVQGRDLEDCDGGATAERRLRRLRLLNAVTAPPRRQEDSTGQQCANRRKRLGEKISHVSCVGLRVVLRIRPPLRSLHSSGQEWRSSWPGIVSV